MTKLAVSFQLGCAIIADTALQGKSADAVVVVVILVDVTLQPGYALIVRLVITEHIAIKHARKIVKMKFVTEKWVIAIPVIMDFMGHVVYVEAIVSLTIVAIMVYARNVKTAFMENIAQAHVRIIAIPLAVIE